MKPIKVVPDARFPRMYRLQWADGVVSKDFYNLTRANDILRNYDRYVDDMVKADRLKPYRFVAGKSVAHAFK